MAVFACLAVFALAVVPTSAVDYTGGGSDPTDWADSANWSGDPAHDTANVFGAHTVNVATDTVRSLRLGDGAEVTLPAQVTLTSNVSESSGLGWVAGSPSALTVEGTWEFSANNGNLWLSDAFNSGPSSLIVRGNAVVNVGGAILSARDDASLSVEGSASVTVAGDFLLPYYDFGAGTLDLALVDLFHDDAVLQGLGFRKQGKPAIREFYTGILESARPSPSPAGPLLADAQRVVAEIHITIADGSIVHALDVFVVEAGKIRSLTYFTADYPPD